MIQITDIILIALFIEAIVNALKPLWTKGENKMTVSEFVAMGMGILLAVTCKINMLAYIVELTYPAWVTYIFYVLTGIALGRGTNFVYDLWNKLKEWQTNQTLPAVNHVLEAVPLETKEAEVDLEVTHWPLSQLLDFARLNNYVLPANMPTDEEKAKAFLIACMFGPEEDDEPLEDANPPEGSDAPDA